MNLAIKLYMLLVTFIKEYNSCIRNVHIAFGDYFADPGSEVIYRVGFMVKKDEDAKTCIQKLKLVIKFPNQDQIVLTNPVDVRNYSFHDNVTKTYPDAPLGLKFDIDRTFGFFELKEIINLNEFVYHFEIDNKSVRGPFNFKTRILSHPQSARMVSFGDHQLPQGNLTIDILKNYEMDYMILLGDYSYDIHVDNGEHGDTYFDAMEPLFTRVPIALVPGNHELADNFNFFANRYIFPLSTFSTTVNNYHFVIHNSLFILFNFDIVSLSKEDYDRMFNYLKQTFEKYSNDSNIKHKLFFVHRPFQCSNYVQVCDTCPNECKIYSLLYKQFDDLLHKYGVKIVYTAHQHYYERSMPLLNYLPDDDGINYLVIGTGGNHETSTDNKTTNTIFKSIDIQMKASFMDTMFADNAIYCRLISSENGEILDSFSVKYKNSEPGIISTKILIICVVIELLILVIIAGVLMLRQHRGKKLSYTDEIAIKTAALI